MFIEALSKDFGLLYMSITQIRKITNRSFVKQNIVNYVNHGYNTHLSEVNVLQQIAENSCLFIWWFRDLQWIFK